MKAYLILGTLLLSVNFHLAQDLIDDEDSSDEIDTQESNEEVYCNKIFNQEIMNEKFYNTPRIS
jgi:hypothetical protein